MQAAPDEFRCPISFDVMRDPVLADDGHTYERSEITRWLAVSAISPMTGSRFGGTLTPNIALRSMIDAWKASQRPAAAPAAAAVSSSSPSEEEEGPLVTPKTFRVAKAGSAVCIQCIADRPMPVAIIAVVDVSGSMSDAAVGKSTPADAAQFSKLDLVKHSLRTMVHLGAEQAGSGGSGSNVSIGMVAYSDTARIALPVRTMDDGGKAAAEAAIAALGLGGSTATWAGLQLGLQQAEAYGRAFPDTAIHVVLLTDGHATDTPPRGLGASVQNCLNHMQTLVTLSCFGFGYNLATKSMEEDVIVPGGGVYGYIPDCTMVGTVFINFCAAAFTTAATHVSVNGVRVPGWLPLGGSRALVLPAGAVPEDAANVTVRYGGTRAQAAAVVALEAADGACASFLARVRVLDDLQAAIAHATIGTAHTAAACHPLLTFVPAAEGADPEFLAAVAEDLDSPSDHKGQLHKACNPGWFPVWGLNHLVAYRHALRTETCINFREAVLQLFATPAFRAVQAHGDTIFAALPAPVPSRGHVGYVAGTYAGSAPAAPVTTMAAYNSEDNGCWTADSEFLMADGVTTCTAANMRAGDVVWGNSKVLCVVRLPVRGSFKIVRVAKDVALTPWHPVRLPGSSAWRFPADIAIERMDAGPGRLQGDDGKTVFVYDVILDSGHVLTTPSGVEVVTLGHGFTGPVVEHPLYGTQVICDRVAAMPGYVKGLVTVA